VAVALFRWVVVEGQSDLGSKNGACEYLTNVTRDLRDKTRRSRTYNKTSRREKMVVDYWILAKGKPSLTDEEIHNEFLAGRPLVRGERQGIGLGRNGSNSRQDLDPHPTRGYEIHIQQGNAYSIRHGMT